MFNLSKMIAIASIALLSGFAGVAYAPASHAATILDDLLTGDDADIGFLGGKVKRGTDSPWGPNHPNTPGSQGGVIPRTPPKPPAIPVPQPGWCATTLGGLASKCNTPGCSVTYNVNPSTGNVVVHTCPVSPGGTPPTLPGSCTANNSSHANTVCKSCAGGIVSWSNGGNVVYKKCPPGSYKPPKSNPNPTSLNQLLDFDDSEAQ